MFEASILDILDLVEDIVLCLACVSAFGLSWWIDSKRLLPPASAVILKFERQGKHLRERLD
jgi:hypothetical protein